MEKYYRPLILPLIAIMYLFFVPSAFGAQIAGQSAQLMVVTDSSISSVTVDVHEQKRQVIETVLKKYNSPLAGSADAFVRTCMKYNLNCYLLPSIAGLESTFGKFIWPDSYNPFGWGGGYIMFDNWDDGIETVGSGLRKNYLDKGADGIEQVGKIYSESPTWSPRVMIFIREFERAEQAQKQLQLNSDTVQL